MAEAVPSTSANVAASRETITIGTRRSLLARIQADIVLNQLKEQWPEYDYKIHAMDPLGDRDKVTALPAFNAKSLWTHELEELLLTGDLDLIVHCLKDMPTQLPATLEVGAILPREDPRDVLVVKSSLAATHRTLASLPEGSVIGTSSLRRTALLRRVHPHLRFTDVRGNVGTRLSKLDDPEGPYSALILAAAGLLRLGLGDRITAYLSKSEGGVPHAVGQGALAVEIREGDEKIKRLLSKAKCPTTTKACLAERSLMRTLEGGCSVPIGVETEWAKVTAGPTGIMPAADYDQSGHAVEKETDGKETQSDQLLIRGVVISLDGQDAVEAELTKRVLSDEDAEQLGKDLAKILVEKGAKQILDKINETRGQV